MVKRTFARLDPFTRGQIFGLRQAETKRTVIARKVKKKDGTHPSLKAVDAVLAKRRANPKWHGEDSSAGGRPRSLTTEQAEELVDLVFAERGKAKVTIPYCRKRLPFLRKVCRETVRQELLRAGLAWLRRRRKTAVPTEWKPKRMTFCRWTLKQEQGDLNRYAYTDGTTFYLSRGPSDEQDKRRAALGPCVYRMASGKDGLFNDNIGPSLYAKSQGLPVKIWGFFCNGLLRYYVLPADGPKKTMNMNTTRYVKLVKAKFSLWRRRCLPRAARVVLVQDHEKCLWKPESVAALKAARCDPLARHPKYSPDLNAIEAWWNAFRQRLDEQAPAEAETRAQFLLRLRRTVIWMNVRWQQAGKRLCRGQEKRATAVLRFKGAKCKY